MPRERLRRDKRVSASGRRKKKKKEEDCGTRKRFSGVADEKEFGAVAEFRSAQEEKNRPEKEFATAIEFRISKRAKERPEQELSFPSAAKKRNSSAEELWSSRERD